MSSEIHPEPDAVRWNVTAAIAGWLCPGLGHMLIGELKRGTILLITIGSLWVAGLLIGGIDVIDRVNHPFWFVGQMLVAPSLGVEYIHRQIIAESGPPRPGLAPRFEPSLGRVHEQGTLYTALAGLLNLLTILDALYRESAGRDAGRHAGRDADRDADRNDQGGATAGGGA